MNNNLQLKNNFQPQSNFSLISLLSTGMVIASFLSLLVVQLVVITELM